MHSELSVEGSESVALLVREELARRRLSRQWLADEARLSLSTLEKALAGSRPLHAGDGGADRGRAGHQPEGRSCLRLADQSFAPETWALMRAPRCNGWRAPI